MNLSNKECNNYLAHKAGWRKFTSSNPKFPSLWIHIYRMSDLTDQNRVEEEYRQNNHLMVTEDSEEINFLSSFDKLSKFWDEYNLVPAFDKCGSIHSCELYLGSTMGEMFDNATDSNRVVAAAHATSHALRALTETPEFEVVV